MKIGHHKVIFARDRSHGGVALWHQVGPLRPRLHHARLPCGIWA